MPASRSIAFAAALAIVSPSRWVDAAVEPPMDARAEPTQPSGEQAVPQPDDTSAAPPASPGDDQGDATDEASPPAVDATTTPEVEPAPAPTPRPDPAPLPPALPPDASSPLERSPDPPPGSVRLHLDVRAPGSVRLHRLGPGPDGEVVGTSRGFPFHTVCTAPCDRVVDVREHTFFVAAPDIVPSPEFTLDGYQRTATIYVKPGRRSVRTAGMGMTIAGALLVPVGILLIAVVPDRDTGRIAGGTVTGVGAAGLIAGIALLVVGRTRVDVDGERVEGGPLARF